MVKPRRPVDIYVRVSRRGGRENFIAAKDQEAIARKFAESEGIPLTEVVLQDIDHPGGTLDRPGLNEARGRVEAGQSGGVIVAYMSRLSRETRQGLALLEEITAAGGAVYAPNLPDYTTADGKMLTTIQLAIDGGYRERKREEFERAKENAIKLGIPIHTRPPVGLRQRRDRRLELDPRTAPVIREVFERSAAGEGPAALGAFLKENGLRTSQGSRTWTKQAVYSLLKNRIYTGELAYGRDRRFVNPAAVEPIVHESLWRAAQRSGSHALAPARSAESKFLLTGILRCHACRYCMQATTTSRGKRIYRCTRTHSAGMCPKPARVGAEKIEKVATDVFWGLTENLEAEGQPDTEGDIAGLEAALERAEEALRDWASPEVQEAIGDLPQYVDGLKVRRAARDAVADELGRVRGHRPAALPAADTLRAAWGRMKPDERRRLLAVRFDCLALRRDGSVVAYPAGTGPDDLPRRGFTKAPALVSFPDPPDSARVLRLEEPPEYTRDLTV
jgi:DNA invertase Pin-like site-specific DNA recombinase